MEMPCGQWQLRLVSQGSKEVPSDQLQQCEAAVQGPQGQLGVQFSNHCQRCGYCPLVMEQLSVQSPVLLLTHNRTNPTQVFKAAIVLKKQQAAAYTRNAEFWGYFSLILPHNYISLLCSSHLQQRTYLIIVKTVMCQELNARCLEREFRVHDSKCCGEEEEVIAACNIPTTKNKDA